MMNHKIQSFSNWSFVPLLQRKSYETTSQHCYVSEIDLKLWMRP